jgi:hypothetical protein
MSVDWVMDPGDRNGGDAPGHRNFSELGVRDEQKWATPTKQKLSSSPFGRQEG